MTETETSRDALVGYDFIFRSTANGILILDAKRCVQAMNPAAAALLGVTLDGVMGREVKNIFSKNQALINLCLREGNQQLDVRLPRQRIAQGIAEDSDDNKRIVLLQDVTEQRSIEQRREMLSKAIAHDLRNPIAALGGYADLVGRFGTLNPQQEKYITRIKQTSSKLHELVKSLVDLAWIEAGMPLAYMPVRLDEIIQKAVRANRSVAQKHQVGVAVSLQTPLPLIMGDPVRLQMVIQNLLYNAV
ncbi:MAG: histidine kinase dimerization/phospho-acceptor domain-containing protein, partial [Chloroflexota bacterium]